MVAIRCRSRNSDSLSLAGVAIRYLAGMDTREIRAVNFQAIVEWEVAVNNQAERGLSGVIANRLPSENGDRQKSTKYLYQLIKGFRGKKDLRDRSPGDGMCTRLEKAYGLPENWMSQRHDEPIEEIKRYWAMRGKAARPGAAKLPPVTAWPFPGVDHRKVLKLTPLSIGRLESAMLFAATHFGFDIANAAA